MLRPSRSTAWGALLGLGLAYELHEIRAGDDGYPLSRLIRAVFRTHTPLGRAVFLLAVDRSVAWFVPHILNGGSGFAEYLRNDGPSAASSCVPARDVPAGQSRFRLHHLRIPHP